MADARRAPRSVEVKKRSKNLGSGHTWPTTRGPIGCLPPWSTNIGPCTFTAEPSRVQGRLWLHQGISQVRTAAPWATDKHCVDETTSCKRTGLLHLEMFRLLTSQNKTETRCCCFIIIISFSFLFFFVGCLSPCLLQIDFSRSFAALINSSPGLFLFPDFSRRPVLPLLAAFSTSFFLVETLQR